MNGMKDYFNLLFLNLKQNIDETEKDIKFLLLEYRIRKIIKKRRKNGYK